MKHFLFFLFLFVPVFTGLGQEHPDALLKQLNLQQWRDFVPSQAGDMYDVKHYELNLNVDPNVREISGTVTTSFQMLTEGNSVGFDLYRNMIIDSIYYAGQKLSSYTFAEDIINIHLPATLAQGDFGKIAISYHGAPQYEGFEAFSVDTHSKNKILWTLSQPYGAYTWWPCKQTLTDKADSIDVVVTVPNRDNRVASNGVLVETLETEDFITYHWKHKHPVATYLIAIAVTNYLELRTQVDIPGQNPIPVIDYAYPEELQAWSMDQRYVKQAMQFLSERFILYPFADEKYGHARFPYMGGMEHQTMSFMYNLGESLVVHELAHQWFGDYITCGSWHDIWLNEGFAMYCEGLYREHYSPTTFRGWRLEYLSSVTGSPGGSVYRYDISDVNAIFDSRLTYYKGTLVLHTLRKQVGDEAFFNGIRSYLQDPDLTGGFAQTENLRQHIEQAADTSLIEFFDDWIYREGYPSYTIGWQPGDTKSRIKISQVTSHPSVDFFKLKVPIRFTGAAKDTIVWVPNTENGQIFEIDLGFRPTQVECDPNFELITRNNKVVAETIVTGMNNPAGKKVEIYPNPSPTGNIHIHSLQEIKQIEVYTLDGKRIGQTDAPAKETDIQLNTGNYLVKISFYDNTNYTEKLIVK
ncbi:peptidase M1 [Bacteroidia bacterium]|nr:peptidase M1 [Bacteroidia bacterium]